MSNTTEIKNAETTKNQQHYGMVVKLPKLPVSIGLPVDDNIYDNPLTRKRKIR